MFTSWSQIISLNYSPHTSLKSSDLCVCVRVCVSGGIHLDRAGWSGGRHLDREPELSSGRQQNSDAGQRRPNPHGSLLQGDITASTCLSVCLSIGHVSCVSRFTILESACCQLIRVQCSEDVVFTFSQSNLIQGHCDPEPKQQQN